jgi:hypothetical protein
MTDHKRLMLAKKMAVKKSELIEVQNKKLNKLIGKCTHDVLIKYGDEKAAINIWGCLACDYPVWDGMMDGSIDNSVYKHYKGSYWIKKC